MQFTKEQLTERARRKVKELEFAITQSAFTSIRDGLEEELELARIALASLEAEPIGAFHIADQQVGGTSDYIKDGEWPIDNGVIEVYAAQPVSYVPETLPCPVHLVPGLRLGKGCKTETLLTVLQRRAEYYAKLEAMTPEEREKHGASIEAFKAMLPQPAPVDKEFIPKNLDKALGVVGVALPESKEEFNFQTERWIQRLIDRVIRYADEFKEQTAPVVPEEMNFSTACNFVQINGMAKEERTTLAMRAWNACRAAMLQAGNSPAIPGGWISCSERMPDGKTGVLVAREFDKKGDWRMKWATYIPGHPDTNDGWLIPGASWKPSHWMPLPEPPQEEK